MTLNSTNMPWPSPAAINVAAGLPGGRCQGRAPHARPDGLSRAASWSRSGSPGGVTGRVTIPVPAHGERSSRAAHPKVSQLPGGRGEVGLPHWPVSAGDHSRAPPS
jgi:hypothetical protein